MNFEPSGKVNEFSARLRAFMDEHVHPAESAFREHLATTADRWMTPPLVEELKQKEPLPTTSRTGCRPEQPRICTTGRDHGTDLVGS
jgi:hypothetical protein